MMKNARESGQNTQSEKSLRERKEENVRNSEKMEKEWSRRKEVHACVSTWTSGVQSVAIVLS